MAYSLILFDADETLFDFEQGMELALYQTLDRFEFNDSREHLMATYRRVNDEAWSLLEAGLISKDHLEVERFRRLFAAHSIPTLDVPLWVKLASAITIGLGTWTGGKRIIRTLGMRLVKLTPVHGFAAETAASAVLLGTAWFGFPVSTTHVISTSIMGVGATERLSAVKWGLTLEIFVAWIVTLPAAAAMGAVGALVAQAIWN